MFDSVWFESLACLTVRISVLQCKCCLCHINTGCLLCSMNVNNYYSGQTNYAHCVYTFVLVSKMLYQSGKLLDKMQLHASMLFRWSIRVPAITP